MWNRAKEIAVSLYGYAHLLLEGVLFELPLLAWWPVVWIVKLLHPARIELRAAENLVCKYAARTLFFPALLVMDEMKAFYFGTATLFWSFVIWAIVW
jgi:hypothetical protein